MDISVASWFVIVLAAAAANMPFLNERLFLVVPLPRAEKPVWVRLAELAGYYIVVRGIAFFLEARVGNAFTQGWEFYALTACLFLVLAYPGFVLRYLRRRHG